MAERGVLGLCGSQQGGAALVSWKHGQAAGDGEAGGVGQGPADPRGEELAPEEEPRLPRGPEWEREDREEQELVCGMQRPAGRSYPEETGLGSPRPTLPGDLRPAALSALNPQDGGGQRS